MKAVVSLLLTISIMVVGPMALAGTTISRITSNSYVDSLPRIKGNYLVWQGSVDGDLEIFVYNMGTGVTTQITNNDYDDMSARTDGTYVVWQGFDNGEWDIFVWDGTEIQAISDRGAEDVSPQIANGLVVWASEPFGDDFLSPEEVILYDAGTRTHTVLSAGVDPGNTLNDSAPTINDEAVIWVQSDAEDNTTLYMYDLSDGTTTEKPDDVFLKDSPQRDGSLSVLTRHDGHDRELFVYNSECGRYHRITDNDYQDTYPSISENHVAWMSAGEIFLAELKCLALVRPGDHSILRDDIRLSEEPPLAFAWEGIGYDAFKVQFSNDPDFPTADTLTLPAGAESYLFETSLTPTKDDWKAIEKIEARNGLVYWRVEGKYEDGNVTFSETWSFTFTDPYHPVAPVTDDQVAPVDNPTSADQAATGVSSKGDGGGGGGICFIATVAYGPSAKNHVSAFSVLDFSSAFTLSILAFPLILAIFLVSSHRRKAQRNGVSSASLPKAQQW